MFENLATYLRSADRIYVRRNVSRSVREFLFGEFLCRDAWLICTRNSLGRQRGSCSAMLRRQAMVFWLRNFPWNFSFPSNRQVVDSRIVRRVRTYCMYSCGIYRRISCTLNTMSSEIATDFLFQISPAYSLYSFCGKFVRDVYRLGTIYRFVFASIACDRINRSTGRHSAQGFVMRKRNEKKQSYCRITVDSYTIDVTCIFLLQYLLMPANVASASVRHCVQSDDNDRSNFGRNNSKERNG